LLIKFGDKGAAYFAEGKDVLWTYPKINFVFVVCATQSRKQQTQNNFRIGSSIYAG